MRVPPDKGNRPAMSHRDVASANSTLNTFLGPRKRPWIATAGTGQPSQRTPPQPNHSPPIPSTTNVPAASTTQASSDELNSTAGVLLSPAPSEASSPPLSHRSSIQISREHPWETWGHENGNSVVQAFSTPPLQGATVPNPQSPTRQSLQLPTNALRSPSPVQSTIQNQAEMIPEQHSYQSPSLSMSTSVPAAPPIPNPVPRNRMVQNDETNPSSVKAVEKRRRAQKVLLPWMKGLPPLIDNHVKQYPLNTDYERPRIHLLKEACHNGDPFYIALHQIFCCWSIDVQIIQLIPGLQEHGNLAFAFETIGHWLRRNDGIAPHHLRWFADFPNPLINLVTRSAPYRDVVADVGLFLKRMVSDWPRFFQQCRARGFPPLVDEMVKVIALPSPMLRRILFIASRRNMQIFDGPLGEAVDQIFTLDQHGYQQLMSQPVSPTVINDRNQRIIMQYVAILKANRAVPSQTQQLPPVGSTSHPASTAVLPSNTPISAQAMMLANNQLHNSVATSSPRQNYSSPYSLSPQLQQSAQWQAPNAIAVHPNHANQVNYPQYQPVQAQELQHPRHRQQSTGNNPSVPSRSHNFNAQSSSNTAFLVRSPLTTQQTIASPRTSQLSTTAATATRHSSSQQAVSLSRPLVPPAGFTQPPGPINADMSALHQAHLASPRLVPLDGSKDTKFYQSVKGFALSPQKVPLTSSLSTFEFVISDPDWAMVAKDKKIPGEPLPLRCFLRGSLQYRLRCICLPGHPDNISTSDWVVCDTAWPTTVFLEINDHLLEVRRKAHHGKDLPIDITPFIVPQKTGKLNVLKLAVMKTHKQSRDTSYYAAVEVVEILKHKQILDMCIEAQHISASQVLDGITQSLTKPLSTAPDDDDVTMVANDLSIDLADPFTAKIFDIPVRGRSCLHRECFDLEIYLQTRPTKPRRPEQPCMVDVWKCPLCKKDARPHSLVIDDFLVSVRASLAEQDRLDVKAILVSADGSWKPKPELPAPNRKATEDSDDSDGEKPTSTAIPQEKSMNWLSGKEVIELDD
ncbi:hypothetical protein F5884DRAFT_790909 [Xylogone sp. PMI_703]|nr:hypothetical protein F5884DRAFT_790909 [Xylogone sp. PMI_703]